MRAVFAIFAAAAMACATFVLSAPAAAQSNNDDYTPLNSRIKRDRAFPLIPPASWTAGRNSEVNRRRGRDMEEQFSRCVFTRSREDSYELLNKTDFGFVNWDQIGMNARDGAENFNFQYCLSRVARTQQSGVYMTWNAESLRRWLIRASYFDRHDDGPDWIVPGNVVTERTYPLSERYLQVRTAMALADCIVGNDPYTADLYYRTVPASDDELAVLQTLVPAIGPCIPEGQEFELEPFAMRVWLGEALWHASTNNGPAPAEPSQDTQ
ncbi:hypothetical protein GCM10009127_21050 [Alteraurantiacibacter aestuarii]|uniref:hypothetical protein n=1 Tax=Alteraurantiacibacter aestuarii TaxID=650004 RepID=UPI0031D0ECBB